MIGRVAVGAIQSEPLCHGLFRGVCAVALRDRRAPAGYGFLRPRRSYIPVFMVAMATGVWFTVPEHVGKELNAIAV